MKNTLLLSGLVALIVSLSTMSLYNYYSNPRKTVKIEHINSPISKSAVYSLDNEGNAVHLDFNKTAEKVLDGVVHIKSTKMHDGLPNRFNNGHSHDRLQDLFGRPFGQFFGPYNSPLKPKYNRPNRDIPARVGTGSGVIISENGYIVTNNHVIADADDIEITLHDNRNFKAVVVGTDPSTDLALLQIKANRLPTVPFVKSNDVHIGQWVLAVGNPMGLNSTVTAGIVSAKGRNINILKDKYAVEDFIQTDAAINPGNSGGALVNLDGGLIGINTAIASPTGTFAGYGFAVPADMVHKVVEDLIEYGSVQRGVLGVMIRNLDGNLANEKDINITQGVFVDSVLVDGAAAKAGVQVGDVIRSVNGTTIRSSPELQGLIAKHRPGQEVVLHINRSGKELDINVVLNNREGTTALQSSDNRAILKVLGADVEDVDHKLANRLGIKGGVRVKRLYPGKLKKYTQIKPGFIITHIDGTTVKSTDQLVQVLDGHEGGVMMTGVYEDIPGEYYYAFGL